MFLRREIRDKLDISEFGLPHVRAYPIPDEKHLMCAIRMFKYVSDIQDKYILAKNIVRRAKELKMLLDIDKYKPLKEYYVESPNGSDYLMEEGVFA